MVLKNLESRNHTPQTKSHKWIYWHINCFAFNTSSAAKQTVDDILGHKENSKQIRRTKKGVYALNPKDMQKIYKDYQFQIITQEVI